MPHLPDHVTHDPELIAAFAAGDATGSALDEATALVAECADCAALHRDLRAIATALPDLPVPARSRDFRLTPEQADALRPSGWRGLLAAFASPRFRLAAPLGTGLAAAGLAGLLLASPGGLFSAGAATSEGTVATPGAAAAQAAPAEGAGASSAPAEIEAARGTDVTAAGNAPASADQPKASEPAASTAAVVPVPHAAASAAASAVPDTLYASPRDAGGSPGRFGAIAAGDPAASLAAGLPDAGAAASGGTLGLNGNVDRSAEPAISPAGSSLALPILALVSLVAGLALVGLRLASRRLA